MERTGKGGADVATAASASGFDDADGLTNIAKLLGPQDILLDLAVSDKQALFDAVDRHVAHTHALPKGCAAVSLTNRERIGSTGLGQGVAVPHARLRQLGHVVLVYVRLKTAIEFDAPDGHPVQDVLVLLVPEKACQQHLDILAEMTRVFPNRRFRQRLAQCATPEAVQRLFASWPA
jgi:PTS system nitrogen regulatory IIA component